MTPLYKVGDTISLDTSSDFHDSGEILEIVVVDEHDAHQTYRCIGRTNNRTAWVLTKNIATRSVAAPVPAKWAELKLWDVLKSTDDGDLYLLKFKNSGTQEFTAITLKGEETGTRQYMTKESIEDTEYIYIHNIIDIYSTIDI